MGRSRAMNGERRAAMVSRILLPQRAIFSNGRDEAGSPVPAQARPAGQTLCVDRITGACALQRRDAGSYVVDTMCSDPEG
jgi:hypothetical protein